MDLAFGGWDFDLAVPIATAVIAFALWARSRDRSPTNVLLWRGSLAFWGLGLAGALLWALLFLRSGSGQAFSPASVNQSHWSLSQLHKAVGLGVGALMASYLPFCVTIFVALLTRQRSHVLYAISVTIAVTAVVAILPPLVFMAAIVSCALLGVSQCM